ncbi:MAG: YifB family Mg chelatase-like AAA ATPase [Bacteroidales bacterium]|nr:YifB family Mg chelatase-like AAA ATPase [Bacteroidales bacterium]
MLTRIYGAKCIGVEAVKVTVEVDVCQGIGIHLVGLADIAVKESLLRTTTAMESLGYHVPGKRIVINLAPADLHKSGSGYDLPIAIGIIAASGQHQLPGLDKYMIMGELGLNGSVRAVPCALPYAELAFGEGFAGIILPEESALEASAFKDISVFGVKTLNDVVTILEEKEDVTGFLIHNTAAYRIARRAGHKQEKDSDIPDFCDIIGQEVAKRGLEIAAAGGHNVIMVGSPGSGKSSLAKAMAGIMPPMTREEALTTSKIYSIAGKRDARCGLMSRRPFRSPHCSSSLPAMVGGGCGDFISPGEVSLAHNGILFADEFTQMPRSVSEALRAPIEDRKVVISRLRNKVEYPASFMLVAAANPCPCGYWGDGDRCTCTPAQRLLYLNRLSGPILDRIDIQLWLHRVDSGSIINAPRAESSAEVASRVLKARIIQKDRFAAERKGSPGILTNAEMNNRQIERYCPLSSACKEMLGRLMESMRLSMRAYFRIIRVARTIADLEGADEILSRHLAEAAGYRFLDKGDKL